MVSCIYLNISEIYSIQTIFPLRDKNKWILFWPDVLCLATETTKCNHLNPNSFIFCQKNLKYFYIFLTKNFNWKNCIKLFAMYYSCWIISSFSISLINTHTQQFYDYPKDFSVLVPKPMSCYNVLLPYCKTTYEWLFYTVVCFSSKWHIIIVNSSTHTQTKLCYIYNCCRL